jgi:hypothetical protein
MSSSLSNIQRSLYAESIVLRKTSQAVELWIILFSLIYVPIIFYNVQRLLPKNNLTYLKKSCASEMKHFNIK